MLNKCEEIFSSVNASFLDSFLWSKVVKMMSPKTIWIQFHIYKCKVIFLFLTHENKQMSRANLTKFSGYSFKLVKIYLHVICIKCQLKCFFFFLSMKCNEDHSVWGGSALVCFTVIIDYINKTIITV